MKQAKVQAWFILFVIATAVTLSGVFILGAWYSCNKGGGTLITGFKCTDIVSTGTCTIENKTYIDPKYTPFGEKIESYKECLNHLHPPLEEIEEIGI